MTYTESAALMEDPEFQGRVKVAVLTFANYILGEPASEPAHNTRVKWAQSAMANPALATNQIIPNVVMDAAVQADGALIADAALQGAVETTVNKLL